MNSESIRSLPDLRRRIAAALAAVSVDVPSRVGGEVDCSFKVCRAVNGPYIDRNK